MLWNFCYSSPDGSETWILSNDFSEFADKVRAASLRHGTKLVCAGHAIPLSIGPQAQIDAQEVIEGVIESWENTKAMLNN